MKFNPKVYAHYYQSYIEKGIVDTESKIDLQVVQWEALVDSVDDLSYSYAPDKWSVREVLQHILDAEMIFAYRLLTIGRGDQTPLPGFEQNDYINNNDYFHLNKHFYRSAFGHVRQQTKLIIQSMRATDLSRVGNASNLDIDASSLVTIIVGHAAHHFEVLRDRYGADL